MIRSRTASGVRPGLVRGRRDRGAAGAGAGGRGPRLDGLEAVFAVPAQEAVEVPAADAGLQRRGGDGQLR
jgi:hypothetical protein